MRNPYIGMGRSQLRDATKRLQGADIYSPRAAVQIDDAYKATEAAMPQGMQASYVQQRGEALAKLTDDFRSDMGEIRSNQEYGDFVVDTIGDNRQTLSEDEDAGLSTLLDTIVTGGMGSRMADSRYVSRAVADGNRYMDARSPQLDEFRRSKKQSYGDLEEKLLELNQLQGGVPSPVERVVNGNDVRLHTRYEVNPVTGQQQVAPFIDTDTGNILTSTFGMLPEDLRGTASEIVALNALKLMDEGPAKMNRQQKKVQNRGGYWESKDMHHYADAKQGNSKVEMMMAGRGGNYDKSLNIPRYTKLLKNKNISVKEEVDKLRERGYTIEGAVKELADRGDLKPINETSVGKIARSDISNVGGDPEAVYDKLLVTGYDRNMMRDADSIRHNWQIDHSVHPDAEKFATDNLAVAPQTIHMVDLPGLRGAIDRGEIKTELKSKLNTGFDRKGSERDKLSETFGQDNRYIQDLTLTHPFTQQLLQKLPYQ